MRRVPKILQVNCTDMILNFMAEMYTCIHVGR